MQMVDSDNEWLKKSDSEKRAVKMSLVKQHCPQLITKFEQEQRDKLTKKSKAGSKKASAKVNRNLPIPKEFFECNCVHIAIAHVECTTDKASAIMTIAIMPTSVISYLFCYRHSHFELLVLLSAGWQVHISSDDQPLSTTKEAGSPGHSVCNAISRRSPSQTG